MLFNYRLLRDGSRPLDVDMREHQYKTSRNNATISRCHVICDSEHENMLHKEDTTTNSKQCKSREEKTATKLRKSKHQRKQLYGV